MLCSTVVDSWVLFAPQEEQGKLTKCARQVLSLCSSCDIATESILPKDGLSHPMDVSAGGGVNSVACVLGELQRLYQTGDSWKLYLRSYTIQNAREGRQFRQLYRLWRKLCIDCTSHGVSKLQVSDCEELTSSLALITCRGLFWSATVWEKAKDKNERKIPYNKLSLHCE